MSDEPDNRVSFSPLRRWAIGLNVLISILALFAAVVMLNYLASRHYARIHWTPDPRFQLTAVTVQLLQSLTNQVKIVVLYDPDPVDTLYGSVKGLLTEYQAVCPRLDVRYVDYNRNHGSALQAKTQYNLSATGEDANLVIFDCNGRYRVITEREMSEYDLSGVLRGEPLKRAAFKGELRFTDALVAVTEGKTPKACYLTGHGEHDLRSEDSTLGYQGFAELLREKSIDLQPLSLSTNDVPADCQLLILAGPRRAVPSDELQKIDAYLRNGGRALVLLMNTGLRRGGLERLLEGWGVDVGDDLVVDRSQPESATTELLVSEFSGHPVVNPLHGSRMALVRPRSVRPVSGGSRAADAVKVNELAFTGSAGEVWAPAPGGRTVIETNGLIPLMVAVEKGTIAGVNPDRGSTRLVVVGDSVFLAKVPITWGANADFATLAVNWLLDRNRLLGIGARPLTEYRVVLTATQMRAVRWLLLVALPGAVLFAGILVWARRRK